MDRVSQLCTIALAAITAAGCSAPPSSPPQPSTSEPSCAPAEPLPKEPFQADGYQWRLTFSPDGALALWSHGSTFFPTSRRAEIVFSERRDGAWTKPQKAPFAAPGSSDIDPFVTPDGSAVLFSSIRDGKRDADLWLARRAGDGWEAPTSLGPLVNSDSDELYPSLDEAGNLYFGSDRDGDWDIWRASRGADGTFGAAERLGTNINRAVGWEFNPDVSPDGKRLAFTAQGREDGAGGGDIFLADLPGGQPRPVNTCVNTSADEYHPTVLWDSDELVFVRSGKF